MNSLTIDQCIEKINIRLTEEGLPATINVRLLRHYQQQRSIPAPTQEGRFAKYTEEHIDAVVALRKAQDMGVSAKAYTTIATIEKHVASNATVASLGLDTPRWMANSIVGAVSSSSSSSSALDLFSTSLNNAYPALSTRTPDTMYAASNSNVESTEELLKNAALRALKELSPASPVDSQMVSNSLSKSSISNARTMSTLARVVSAPSVSATSIKILDSKSPQTSAVRDITQWTLAHNVCVQIPSNVFSSMSSDKQQAFEAWMAHLPKLE